MWPLLAKTYISGLVQDCSNFIANALELLQSFPKPSVLGSLSARKNDIGISNFVICIVPAHGLTLSGAKPFAGADDQVHVPYTVYIYIYMRMALIGLTLGIMYLKYHKYIDALVHDCCISSVLAMEVLQSCIKPSTCWLQNDLGEIFIQDHHIQLSAVITRSNITWYCIHHCNDCDKAWTRVWTHKIHPIPRLNGRAMGWNFVKI